MAVAVAVAVGGNKLKSFHLLICTRSLEKKESVLYVQ